MSKSVRQGVGLPQEWIRRKREDAFPGGNHGFCGRRDLGCGDRAQIATCRWRSSSRLDVDERVALTLAVRIQDTLSNDRLQAGGHTAPAGWETRYL